MHCFYCKGNMEKSTTNHVVNMKHAVIIIKNAPCTECTQCGQSFYNDDVMMQLESIIKDMQNNMTEIAVVSYTDRVA